MGNRINELASEIRKADRGVGFTGAGVSTPSGIPDFRSDGGIWEKHDPDIFNIQTFRRNPAIFWKEMLAVHREAFAGDPEPNAAHHALARLEEQGHLEAIITQNADKLHQESGVDEVIELHGNLEDVVCQSCQRRETMGDAIARAEDGELPPECRHCEGVLKPDGILFGEQLPKHALFRAHALAEKSEIFLVAGSSLTVEPAASLPETAANQGATVVIINLDPTPYDEIADYMFREDVTTVLPKLADAVE